MPKKKEIMAGYIRESDPALANSTTIESQAKAVRQYAQKEGYLYDTSRHEYMEAISAYTVPYMERTQLLAMLDGAQRHEFTVLVVTEIRAISRRQVEVFIIYDLLQKYGVRIETIKEKFEDDAMGRVILGLRAGFAEIEREQSYWRMQRGKKDRIEIGKAPNGHKQPAYGYILTDTEKEIHGRYEYNHEQIILPTGTKTSVHEVCNLYFTLLKQGESLHAIAYRFNDMGIPPPATPSKGTTAQWTPSTLMRMAKNPIYKGEVWANKYKAIKNPKTGKQKVLPRPTEEWIRLPDAPAYITALEYDAIQTQLHINKQEAIRNNKHVDNLGLLRGGYIYCGICGCRMPLRYPNYDNPRYTCNKKSGNNQADVRLNHNTMIRQPALDRAARENIIDALKNPDFIRARVEAQYREIRKKKQPVTEDDINATIAKIQVEIDNLFDLARYATNQTSREKLGLELQELEKRQREAAALLDDLDRQQQDREALEAEIVRFEAWVERVRPDLTNPDYVPTYDELRLAVRVLGLICIVYPTQGDWPFRARFFVTVPEIMKKIHCGANDGLFAMDPLTQQRTPRGSSLLFGEICRANAITEELVERYAPQAMDRIFASS